MPCSTLLSNNNHFSMARSRLCSLLCPLPLSPQSPVFLSLAVKKILSFHRKNTYIFALIIRIRVVFSLVGRRQLRIARVNYSYSFNAVSYNC